MVWRHAPLQLEEIELDAANGDVAQQLHERFDTRRLRLDLGAAPLLKLVFAHDATRQRWVLLLIFHHLVADHEAMAEVQREVRAFLAGREADLDEPVPFRNYVARARLGVSRDEHEAFFRDMLGDVDEPTLPFGLRNVQGDGRNVEEATRRIDDDLGRRLRSQARQSGVSAATLFHLAWAVVLGKLSQRDDVVFGTVLFGRLQGQRGASRALGMFINTLPVRMTLGKSVHAAVGETHRVLTQLLRHEHASLALAQQCSGIAVPLPLFSALLNYRHSPAERSEVEEPAWAAIESLGGEERTNYPVALNVDDFGEGFSLTVQTAHELGTASRVCGYMNTALEQLVSALEDEPETVAGRLPVLPASERAVLLEEWCRTEVSSSQERWIHELFEARADASAESAALIHGDAQWSYGEVNARANSLARHLRGLGVGPDTRVALCVERGLGMVVGLLAVLKAGGAYVPLDPTYPAGRLAYMLADSAPVVVLAQAGTQALVSSLDVAQPVLLLDGPDQPWAAQAADNLERPAGLGPDSLAYVIYTSGSTGQPKGVCNTIAGLNNRLGWYADRLQGSASRTAFKTGIGFVDSVTEILETLLAGSALVVFDRLSVMDVDLLAGQIHRFHVTHLVLVPSLLRHLLSVDPSKLSSVEVLVCSGEWLSPVLVRETRARLPHVELLNFYGSSEVNGDATAYDYSSEEALNIDASLIGWPISNTRTYILDKSYEPVPLGVTGELHVTGTGIARGYLNRPDLSAERFVPDPFAAEAGGRMYRTGDLARYRADGAIEYLGRIDFQVKLRGFRIELGEIEAALVAQAGVREAVVLASGEVGDKRLVAYYTLEEGATSGADALRSALAERLSDYMVPSAFVRLERLPLTPNGKLDRAALPTPDRDAYASRGYVPPEGEPEACIAAIWAELLEVERIGRHDNFFELGGHSLLAVRLISRVRRQFDVEVTLQDVFERPVLSDLARTVSTARHSALPPLVAMPRDAGSMLPVSFAQQRMWFLTQLDDVSEAYHIPIGLRLRGALDRAALRAALDRLMTRHEALRTTFRGVDGSPCHMIGPSEQAFALAEQDVPLTDDNDATLLQRLVDEEAHAPFDLAAGPLVRGRLLRFGEQDHVLLLTMHHIVSDGWSLGILTRELGMLYEAFCNGAPDPLAPLPVQYADYAAWQRRCLDGDGLQQQIDYWRRTLAGSRALLTLPTDRPRPPRQDHAGAAIDVTLDAALTAGVRALSRRLGLTPYMTVLTGWAIVLAKLSGQQDVVIGTPVANRTPAEVEGLIGFFVNTLALRIDVDEQKTVQTLLEHVKTRTSEAQSHQSLPFEQVVEVLRPERSLSHSPLFQVMLVWHNLAPAVPTMGNLALSTLSPTRHTAKFDLLLELVETSDTIRGSLEYATALFDRETAQRFDRCLHAVLRAMVAGPDEIVGTVSLLDEADRTRLLAFNTVAPDYPHDRRIDALFEAQAQRTPDGTALVHGTRRLSYAELDARANQLAHALIEAGVNPQTRVAICVERGVEMVIAIIATMKAGAAYVPLDPGYPAQRLDYLLGDCAPAAVLAQTVTREKFGTPAAPVVLLDADAARIARQPVTAPRVSPRSSGDLAYVIYTSGSTGAPKGVAMPHAALANLVHWQRQQSGPDTPRTLQFAALGFDVAFQEMFGTLCAGGELHLIDAGLRLDFHGLFDYLCMQRVQRLYLPYIALQNFAEAVVAAMGARENACELREVIVAGEQLRITPQIAECFRHLPGCRLHNHYGPTESHVVVACALPADVATWPVLPPIGHPLPNVRVHVLDARGQPVPIGASGEIYIGGVQVAHRYLERAALTASQFLPDPFGTEPGARLYRTSDLGRWRADGSLEYLGRDDGQIKLRGFRIEPGEIEAALLSMPGITAVAVVAREDEPGDKRLVAYYTGPAATPGQLRNYLLASLPEHMVPAAYVNLAALPLTPNGKLDDRALPTPAPETVARRSEGNDGAAPVGEIEQKLAALWAQVLKLEYVGRHDNFFELGGHSLLAVRLIELIRKTFAVDIGINTLFTCPNLNQLAKHIEFPLALASPVEMLLPIKVKEAAESTPPTLFCIHPASGLSWSFAGLTRYPRGRFQIYGLQSGGIAEGTSLAPSVEAMSSEYIHVIRTVQPHGPYRLIGWSMGGLVAFEVACQLQALGETVDFVGVLDSFLLYTTQVVPYDEQYTLMNILRTAGCDVGGLDPRQLLTVPEVSRLVRQEGHIFSMLSAAHVGGLVEVRRNNLAITQRYLPKRRFHGTLTHFTATNEPNRVGSPERHWKPYVEGRIRSLPIACTHDDIGTPAYLAPIAELIDAIFEGLE
ncbi:amino acid adenylation domain-containing protein [Burkholderia stagnalis]